MYESFLVNNNNNADLDRVYPNLSLPPPNILVYKVQIEIFNYAVFSL